MKKEVKSDLDLVDKLSKFNTKELKELNNLAQAKRKEDHLSNIPPTDIEALRRAYRDVQEGQTFNYDFDLPLRLALIIKAEDVFGHLSNYELTVRLPKSSTDTLSLKFWNYFIKP